MSLRRRIRATVLSFRVHKTMFPHQCLCHADCALVFFHIVDPHKCASLLDCVHCGDERTFFSLVCRKIQCESDDGLAGGAEQDGKIKLMKEFQLVDDFQIHLLCLAEAYAGVENDLITWDTGSAGKRYAPAHIL